MLSIVTHVCVHLTLIATTTYHTHNNSSNSSVHHQYAKLGTKILTLYALSPIAATSISAGIASMIPIKDISDLIQAVPPQLLILKLNLYSDNNHNIY